ncbi:MAG: deoxyribodipyrimidine photo-lyase [Geminicoccaceae bacterium]
MSAPVLVWFRNDLRLADNPALAAAAATGAPVLPLFVLDDEAAGPWKPGGASRWWLHHSLTSLAADLGGLVLRRGEAAAIVGDLVREHWIGQVFWNRRYEPFAIEQDKAIKAELQARGVEVKSFKASLVHEPWEVAQKGGGPYKVYTPYSRAWFDLPPDGPALPRPDGLTLATGVASDRLEDWALLPTRPDWAGGLRESWRPGEAAARERALAFIEDSVASYGSTRNAPGTDGVSRLSPYLHFGEISPRQLLHAVQVLGSEKAAFAWVRQLCWRDFAYHTLYHFPQFPDRPLREEFERFPWAERQDQLRAWQRGRTGYPIVDAGMRELWHTGWMHNRVRMITGSFLAKDLLVPWQAGAAWFWDTLVDADLANNSMGWQWVAGCGIDAAPYFRIFNPLLQGEKFDPHGTYVRRWAPELAKLPAEWIHKPHAAPAEVLRAAGVTLDGTYPRPIVDHSIARDRALAAYQSLREAA